MDSVDSKAMVLATDMRAWLGRACLVTGFALAAYGCAAYFSGAQSVWLALQRIGGGALAAGLGATVVSLAVRAARWQLILKRLGHRLPAALQARIYLSGLALSSTPGKLGETSRSLLLRPHGVPYADSLGAFVCDRLSDVVGVAALGAAMAAWSGARQAPLEIIAALSLAGSVGLAHWRRSKPAHRWLATRRRWLALAAAASGAWARLWRGGSIASYIALGALAYAAQGLIFAGFVAQVHNGLGVAPCLAIFVNATLIGAASLVPGGLGPTDAALVVQLQSAGVPAGAALAAAVASRACTLWFAWLLGLGALLSFGRPAATA